MTEWPNWRVSALTPIVVVEDCGEDLVRNVATFQIAGEGLLRSPEGEQSVRYARLGAAAPDLARTLEAAYFALRSYQLGNSAPDLAEEICRSALEALARAGGTDV